MWFQAITCYLKGVLKKESGPEVQQTKPKKVKKVYMLRDFVKHHYRSRVEKEIPFKSTDKEYLGSYQRAVTSVINKMTNEDHQEAERLLEEWNAQGGPSDLQLK